MHSVNEKKGYVIWNYSLPFGTIYIYIWFVDGTIWYLFYLHWCYRHLTVFVCYIHIIVWSFFIQNLDPQSSNQIHAQSKIYPFFKYIFKHPLCIVCHFFIRISPFVLYDVAYLRYPYMHLKGCIR